MTIARFFLALALSMASLTATPVFADVSLQAVVRVVVPAHEIARGATITEADLTFAMLPGAALMANTVVSMDALRGMEARRVLHAGEALRGDDVRHPVVVIKGQTVTMLFSAPGVELNAVGRAMSEGGVGDTVTIQNPASFRMVSAIVTAPGTVRALGPVTQAAQITARK